MIKEKVPSEVLVPKKQSVVIGGQKFEVRPFSVRDIIHFTRDLVDGLSAIKQKYPSLEFKSEDTLKYLPLVLDEAPRLFSLLAASVDMDGDWLENQSDLVGVSKLFAIVAEINDFGAIILNFKAGWSKLKQQVIA